MDWTQWPWSKPKPGVVHRVTAALPTNSIKKQTDGKFRNGMWVATSKYVGILKEVNGTEATVMTVDDQGLNLLELKEPLVNLRQATHNEIPTPRRPEPEVSIRLGYGGV